MFYIRINQGLEQVIREVSWLELCQLILQADSISFLYSTHEAVKQSNDLQMMEFANACNHARRVTFRCAKRTALVKHLTGNYTG